MNRGGEVLGQRGGVARAYTRGMTVRVTGRVAQDQVGAIHSDWKKLIEIPPGPNIVQRGPLNFGIRATLGDTTANNDAGTGLGSTCNQAMMLRGETRVGNLKCIEHAQSDETWQVRQRAGGSNEADHALISKSHYQINQSFPLQGCSISAMELQDIDMISSQAFETGLEVPCENIFLPDMINLEMIFVLRKGTAAFCRQIELASSRADITADALLADSIIG